MNTSANGFSPFPALFSERLKLRQLIGDDVDRIFFLRSNSTVNRYIKRPLLKEAKEAEAFINRINKGVEERRILYWAICMKNTPSLIGTICLWNFNENHSVAEMGYELHPTYQGKGIMNEAMVTVVEYAHRELHLTAIEAFTHRNNGPSTSLLEKNNFLIQPHRTDPDVETNVIYKRVLLGE